MSTCRKMPSGAKAEYKITFARSLFGEFDFSFRSQRLLCSLQEKPNSLENRPPQRNIFCFMHSKIAAHSGSELKVP